MGWGSTSSSGRSTPGKDLVPFVLESGWASGPVWTGAENLASHRDSIPGPSSPWQVAIPTELPRSTVLCIIHISQCRWLEACHQVEWLYVALTGRSMDSYLTMVSVFFSPKRPDSLWSSPSFLFNGNRSFFLPGVKQPSSETFPLPQPFRGLRMEEGIVLLRFMTSPPYTRTTFLYFTLLYFTLLLSACGPHPHKFFWYLHDILFSVRIIPVLYDGFFKIGAHLESSFNSYCCLGSFFYLTTSPRLLT